MILVVAATRAEARYVPDGIVTLVTGIGKVDAAIAVTEAIVRKRPDRVINIGTAGALRPDLSGLFVPSAVINHDLSAEVLRQLGYPAIDELPIDGGDGTVVATGDTFVTDSLVRDVIAARAHLVDMEAFAVVAACGRFGVPCQVVKHVSDQADESAMDWPRMVDASARDLGVWLGANV